MSDIYCISDLHIGDGTHRDNFTQSELREPFMEFLEFIQDNNSKLIIVGDLLELWMCNIGDVLTFNKDIFEKLDVVKPVYVSGNHDVDLLPFAGTDLIKYDFILNMITNKEKSKSIYTNIINDKKFVFRHGHKVDEVNSLDIPAQGRIWTILCGLIKDDVCDDSNLKTYMVEKALFSIPNLPSEIAKIQDIIFRKNMSEIYEMPYLSLDLKNSIKKMMADETMAVSHLTLDSNDFQSMIPFYNEQASLEEERKGAKNWFWKIVEKCEDAINEARERYESVMSEITDFREEYEEYLSYYSYIDDTIKKMFDTSGVDQCELVKKLKAEYSNEIVIAGHTHNAGRCGDWYYNTGEWRGEKSNVLRIDEYSVCSFYNWENRELVENDSLTQYVYEQ